MKYLITPSAYKGSFSATLVAESIACGISQEIPEVEIDLLPIADGGDGTIEALELAVGGYIRFASIQSENGLFRNIAWLEHKDLAIVELASASGLALLKGELEPLHSHTKATGEVILTCINLGFKKIVVCLGGSASTDGAAGLLTALGASFWKTGLEPIKLGASELDLITGCDLKTALSLTRGVQLKVAVHVINPLLGKNGAAAIYGPQKGASEDLVLRLDSALTNYANILEEVSGRKARDLPGAGAAGGTAFGLACGLGAEIISGFEWLSNLIGLESRVKAADVVITGEGSLDAQSLFGKAIGRLAALCRKYQRPLLVIPAVADLTVDWSSFGIQRVICAATPPSMATLTTISQAAREAVSN